MPAVTVRLGAATASLLIPTPPLRPRERRTPPAAAAVGAGVLLRSGHATPGSRLPLPAMAQTHDSFSPRKTLGSCFLFLGPTQLLN